MHRADYNFNRIWQNLIDIVDIADITDIKQYI